VLINSQQLPSIVLTISPTVNPLVVVSTNIPVTNPSGQRVASNQSPAGRVVVVVVVVVDVVVVVTEGHSFFSHTLPVSHILIEYVE
jgi:hypothetical protein